MHGIMRNAENSNAQLSSGAGNPVTDVNSMLGSYVPPRIRSRSFQMEHSSSRVPPVGLGLTSGLIPPNSHFPHFSPNAISLPVNNMTNSSINMNANYKLTNISTVNSCNSKSSTPSSSRAQGSTDSHPGESRRQRKKAEKEERDRQKQAEKKKRRLEKALATAAAIRTQLEKKKQKRKEEELRLDEEGAALAEAVALHVLVDEDSVYRKSHSLGYSQSQSFHSNRKPRIEKESDEEEEIDHLSNPSGDSEDDDHWRLSRDRTGDTCSSADANSHSVTSRNFGDLELRISMKEIGMSNSKKVKSHAVTHKSPESSQAKLSSDQTFSKSISNDLNADSMDERDPQHATPGTSSMFLEAMKFNEKRFSETSPQKSAEIRGCENSAKCAVGLQPTHAAVSVGGDGRRVTMLGGIDEAEIRAKSSSDKAKKAEMAAGFAAVQAMAAIRIAEEARVEAEAARKAAEDAIKSAMDKKLLSPTDDEEEELLTAEEERIALRIKLQNTEKLLHEKNEYISELEQCLEDLKAKIEASRLQCPNNQEAFEKETEK